MQDLILRASVATMVLGGSALPASAGSLSEWRRGFLHWWQNRPGRGSGGDHGGNHGGGGGGGHVTVPEIDAATGILALAAVFAALAFAYEIRRRRSAS